MSNYNKFIGSAVGGILTWLVAKFALPEFLATPDFIDGVAGFIGGMIGTYIAPANKPA